MAEKVEIEIEVGGIDDSVSGFERLKIAQQKASEEASRLSSEIRKLEQSGTAAAEDIDKLRVAQIRAATASQQLGVQATALDRGAAGMAGKFGQVGTALGSLGPILGQLSPRLGSIGSLLGQVGGATTSLSGALGPVGIAIAAVTTAVGIGTSIWNLYQDATRASREEVERQTASIRDLVDAMREQERQGRISRGLGSAAETRESAQERLAAQQSLVGTIAELRQRAARARGSSASFDAMREAEQAEREAARLERFLPQFVARTREAERLASRVEGGGVQRSALTNDEIRQQILAQQERELEAAGLGGYQRTESGRISGAFAGRDRGAQQSSRAAQEREREEYARNEALKNAIDRRQADEERSAYELNERLKNARSARDADEMQAAQHRADELKEIEERVLEARLSKLEEFKERQREEYEEMRAQAQQITGPVVGGLTDALASVIAGSESADKAFAKLLSGFLSMISQQSALKAAFEFAEAIASFARYDFGGGAGHVAAGVAYTAVAIATGAGAVAVAPPSGSQAAAAPQRPSQEAQGGNTYVVNYNAPYLGFDTMASLGRGIGSLTRAAGTRDSARV